jgi:hypothetical protein
MQKGRAFVLVGHSDWRKSRTIHRLVSPINFGWWQYKKDVWVYVKPMSDDDKPETLLDFVNDANLDLIKTIIIALRPDFIKPDKTTDEILHTLAGKYEVYFYVLNVSHGRTDLIKDIELGDLKKHGIVRISGRSIEEAERTREFGAFVDSVLKAE